MFSTYYVDISLIKKDYKSKGDLKINVLRISRNVTGFNPPYVVYEGLFYVPHTFIYVVRRTLGEHLNCTIGQIANKAIYIVTISYSVSSKTKTNSLNMPFENYVPGYQIHNKQYLCY
jgi:hypothetical protein